MILACVLVVLAMAANDFLAVMLVISESKGRALLAGACDGAGDLTRVAYLAVGIDSVIKGVSPRAVAVLACMVATSVVTTTITTRWARRIKAATT